MATSRRTARQRRGQWSTLTSGSYHVTTYADADGFYLVRGVPEGRVEVTAARSDGTIAGTSAATLSGEGSEIVIDVALKSTGNLFGSVVRAVDGVTPAQVSQVARQLSGRLTHRRHRSRERRPSTSSTCRQAAWT